MNHQVKQLFTLMKAVLVKTIIVQMATHRLVKGAMLNMIGGAKKEPMLLVPF